MQGPTHVLVGVIIQNAFGRVKNGKLRFILIAATALLCHSIFDRIARLTFHPPEADFSDPFWVGFHLFVLLAFIASLYFFWKKHETGIFFSLMPDMDWVIIHGSKIFGIPLPFYQKPLIHTFLHGIIDSVPPFSFLQHLPDLTHTHGAVVTEFILGGIILAFIFRKRFQKN